MPLWKCKKEINKSQNRIILLCIKRFGRFESLKEQCDTVFYFAQFFWLLISKMMMQGFIRHILTVKLGKNHVRELKQSRRNLTPTLIPGLDWLESVIHWWENTTTTRVDCLYSFQILFVSREIPINLIFGPKFSNNH